MYDGLRDQDEEAIEDVERGLERIVNPADEVTVAQDVAGIRIRRILSAQIDSEGDTKAI
ncbi:hypothetical protein D3C84_1040220 [compost metagenome]